MRGILVAVLAVLLGAAVIGAHGTQGGISVDGPRGAIRVASGGAGAGDAGPAASPLFSAALTSTTTPEVGGSPTFTRGSSATKTTWDESCTSATLSTVGVDTARHDCWCEGGVGGTRRCGLLVEAAATNVLLRSEEIENLYWAPKNNISIAHNTAAAPNGTMTSDAFTETTGTDLVYSVDRVYSTTAGPWSFSVYLKAGARQYARTFCRTGASTYPGGYFDLTTCATSAQAGAVLYCTALGDGWVRATATFSSPGYSGYCSIAAINTWEAPTYSGTAGTTAIYVWGAQLETGTATSYIATTTAAVTRAADSLRYDYTGTASGTLLATVLCPSSDYTGTTAGLVSMSDGTAANRIALLPVASGDVARLLVTAASTDTADVQGTTDIFDGVSRELRGTWSATSVKLYVGGASEGTEDTSATIPATTYLYLGSSTGVPSGCLLSSVQVYDEVVTP